MYEEVHFGIEGHVHGIVVVNIEMAMEKQFHDNEVNVLLPIYTIFTAFKLLHIYKQLPLHRGLK